MSSSASRPLPFPSQSLGAHPSVSYPSVPVESICSCGGSSCATSMWILPLVSKFTPYGQKLCAQDRKCCVLHCYNAQFSCMLSYAFLLRSGLVGSRYVWGPSLIAAAEYSCFVIIFPGVTQVFCRVSLKAFQSSLARSERDNWIGLFILQIILVCFQELRKRYEFYQIWFILQPTITFFFFAPRKNGAWSKEYFLRAEKVTLEGMFVIVIHEPVVLASSYTEIHFWPPKIPTLICFT